MLIVLDDETSSWRAMTPPTTSLVEVGVGVGNVKSGRDDTLLDGVDAVTLTGVVEQGTTAVVVLRARIVRVVLTCEGEP